MKNNLAKEFREVSFHFCPQLEKVLFHESVISRSTWEADIQTGKAVEITALCALVAAFIRKGYNFILPSIYLSYPELFYLRNSIPRHHDAQAGHEAAFENLLPLKDRFIAALTPKAEVENGNIVFSIFREGHPIHKISHKIKANKEYLDRPDIVITQGRMHLSASSEKEIDFLYTQAIGNVSGKLRVKNDNNIPIISYSPDDGGEVLINGVIECSIGKGNALATNQITRYRTLFASVIVPVAALVNGKANTGKAIEHEIFINLDEWDRDSIIKSLTLGFDKFVDAIDANIIKS